jgi:hypothetical protein
VAVYSIDFEADYGDGQRSRGLAVLGIVLFLKAVLLLPHLLIVGVLSYVAFLVAYIGYWVIALTGELPEFFYTFPERVLQWQARATGWLLTLRDEYPPFAWDVQDYGVRLTSTEQPGPRSRVIAVLGILTIKGVAVIPHVVVLAFVQLAAIIAVWVGYVVVAFTGSLPRGIFDFAVGATRWNLRLSTWLFSLTDEYPPFRMTS